jgi:MFS family permease
MVFRILSGGAAASVQAVGAGTLSDIYEPHVRGRAMGYFYLGPLMGPMLAPVIGGAITIKWGWRGTQWFLVILGGIITMFIFFLLPETLPRKKDTGKVEVPVPDDPTQHADVMVPVHSRSSYVAEDEEANGQGVEYINPSRHHRRLWHSKINTHALQMLAHRDAANDGILYRTFIRPLRSFRLLKYPPVPLTIVYATYVFMTLYILNVALQTLYSESPYYFSSLIQGLVYLPNSVGYLIASIGNGYWSDWIIGRCIRRHGYVIAEKRLSEQVYLGSVLIPISLIIFGWCAEYRLMWVTPLVGTFLFGIGAMLVFGNVATYLVDALPGRGSSGVALNNLARMTFAGIGTFITAPWLDGMGYGWMFTMLAIGSILCFSSILVIKWKGPVWRESFDIAKLS